MNPGVAPVATDGQAALRLAVGYRGAFMVKMLATVDEVLNTGGGFESAKVASIQGCQKAVPDGSPDNRLRSSV
jgi:hypothetical protein